jgi:hypothetical protein
MELLPPELWAWVGACLPWADQLQLRATATSCGRTDLISHWWRHRTPPPGAWLAVGLHANHPTALAVDWTGQLRAQLIRVPPVRRQVRQVACSSGVGQSTLWWVLELDGRLWQGSRQGWVCLRLPPMRYISASSTHALAVGLDGRGWSRGRGKCAAVALARRGPWRRWRPLCCPVPLRTAEAGVYASILLDRKGGVWTCGENSWEQLGQGVPCSDMPRQPVPMRLPCLPPMRQALVASGLLALVSESSELWLGGWCSPMLSVRPLRHSAHVRYVRISNYHIAVVREDGVLWTGGYFPQDGKLARPTPEPVCDSLQPTAHTAVQALHTCTLGVNRACTAWAGADGTWQWAGASSLAT